MEQVFIQWTRAASDQGVGNQARVVTNIPYALGFASIIEGKIRIRTLQLDGVGQLGIDGFGCTIEELVFLISE